jgi:tryptophan halogenase
MRIVIVGGGTAGWLSALFLSKVKPGHNITIIESSKEGIIGVGESSTGVLLDIVTNSIWDFGCDPVDFMRETGATLKYGIKFTGWTPDRNQFYYGPIDGSSTGRGIPDGIFGYGLDNFPEKLHLSTLFGNMMEHNISPISKSTNKFNVNTHALHFDTFRVGNYFKKLCISNGNVTHIDSKITRVNISESGMITSLNLEDFRTIDGDFFVDASGFKRLLISELGGNWISYKKHLPVNSALPFFLKYKEGETPFPYTHSWALGSGWMWQIPLQERIGCGYIFSDDFITAEQAHAEIEQTLGHKVEPTQHIKFNSGRLENVWVNNCLAVGLSSAFTEPLEATSVHSIIIQMLNFVFEYLKPTLEETINPACVKHYNMRTGKMYDDFKDFLVGHYLGGRTDTEFWRHITNGNTLTPFTDTIVNMCKTKMPTQNDFNEYPGAAGWHLWQFVLAGVGKFPPGVGIKSLDNYLINDSVQKINDIQRQVENMLAENYSYNEFNQLIKNSNIKYF